MIVALIICIAIISCFIAMLLVWNVGFYRRKEEDSAEGLFLAIFISALLAVIDAVLIYQLIKVL